MTRHCSVKGKNGKFKRLEKKAGYYYNAHILYLVVYVLCTLNDNMPTSSETEMYAFVLLIMFLSPWGGGRGSGGGRKLGAREIDHKRAGQELMRVKAHPTTTTPNPLQMLHLANPDKVTVEQGGDGCCWRQAWFKGVVTKRVTTFLEWKVFERLPTER